jgi:hypothetical protein
MKPETAVSLAMLALYLRNDERADLGHREDVVQLLLELRAADIDTPGLRLRRTPNGVESDEVSRFIGRLAMGGYVVQESPIRLTDYGVALLRSEVGDHAREPDVEAALSHLGISAEAVTGGARASL